MKTYLSNIRSAWATIMAAWGDVFYSSDCFWNVVLGGQLGQSISLRLAINRQNGSRFACVMCRLLNLYKRDHCSNVLTANQDQNSAI